jgi:hypothetical protein
MNVRELVKSLMLELNWVNELDVDNIVTEEGIYCGNWGLWEWNDIEEMNREEWIEWIKCYVLSDDDIDI